MTALERLQNWYKNHCDGDWEHSFQIKIETLDNPGWNLKIDLEGTSLEFAEVEQAEDKGEFDWYIIKSENKRFIASGDSQKLNFLIEYFLDQFLPKYSNSNFLYEIYLPLTVGDTLFWAPSNAVLVNENSFRIVQIPEPKYNTVKTKSLDELTFDSGLVKSYQITDKIGDTIETELIETFDGLKVAKKIQ